MKTETFFSFRAAENYATNQGLGRDQYQVSGSGSRFLLEIFEDPPEETTVRRSTILRREAQERESISISKAEALGGLTQKWKPLFAVAEEIQRLTLMNHQVALSFFVCEGIVERALEEIGVAKIALPRIRFGQPGKPPAAVSEEMTGNDRFKTALTILMEQKVWATKRAAEKTALRIAKKENERNQNLAARAMANDFAEQLERSE